MIIVCGWTVWKKAGVRLYLAVQKAWSHNGGKFVISNHEYGSMEFM
jgi:hypothetical protein